MRRTVLALSLFIVLLTNPLPLSAAEPLVTGRPARYVRIELPGDEKILTLAEVEVFVRGKNIARSGKASQSSLSQGGVPERAVDRNKSPDYGQHGQTHTEAYTANPWWELDLRKEVDIEKIGIWNRSGYNGRLHGFTLRLLDAGRRDVFVVTKVAAPEAMTIDIKKGTLTYLTFNGQPGAPMKQ